MNLKIVKRECDGLEGAVEERGLEKMGSGQT